MEHSAALIDALRAGALDPARLAASGCHRPDDAARALASAAREPALAGALERWVPVLLRSARPAQGAFALERIAAARREAGRPLDLRETPLLPAVVGASGVLSRRLQAHPDWVDDLEGPLPDAPVESPVAQHFGAIRAAKYRGLLRIAARDLAGRPFRDSLRELSDLADRCLTAALGCATEEVGGAAPALLALGKLGGRELNFSSDVDLLVLYEPPAEADAGAEAERVARLVRRFKTRLEEPSEEGFGYRVDLDLRPEGKAGVVANPLEAALAYYESFGAEWERQMLIRLRPVAGAEAVARAFARGIRPFVYRKLIGPDVMLAVREMKLRIETERRDAGRDLDACLKEGPGGIRDVEFLVQAFQLLHGGREPSLRTGNVLDALERLCALALLPEPAARALADAYLWLRRAEHCLQLAEEQQVSRVPRDADGQIALARCMGYDAADAATARTDFLDDWTAVRSEVRTHFQRLVLGDAA